jgi:hypothetical protein
MEREKSKGIRETGEEGKEVKRKCIKKDRMRRKMRKENGSKKT